MLLHGLTYRVIANTSICEGRANIGMAQGVLDPVQVYARSRHPRAYEAAQEGIVGVGERSCALWSRKTGSVLQYALT